MEQEIRKEKFNSIAWLRLLAIMMIVYDHLIAMRNPDWMINRLIEGVLNKPLHIIQSYGAFGVCLFFLISGFLIMFANEGKDKVGLKIVKKIGRIYLSVLIAFGGFGIFQWIMNQFTVTYWAQFSKQDWLVSATLFGYFNGKGDVINGTTWFLIPLFMFYLLGIFMIKRANKNYERAMIETEGILSAIVLLFVILKRCFSIELCITCNFVFIFIPMTGVLLYGIYKNKMNFWRAIIMTAYNYALLVVAIHEFNYGYYTDSPYLVSYIYALALFALCLLGEKHFAKNKLVDFVGKIGLPIYLLHMTWGAYFMTVLGTHMPFTITAIISLLLVGVLAWFHDKYIDKWVIRKLIR